MLNNFETANNYKIIVNETANSQKRALLNSIVGIVNIKNPVIKSNDWIFILRNIDFYQTSR